MRVQQQNHPHSAFYSEISLKFKGWLGSEAKTALQGPMKTWCCAPLVRRFYALFLRLLVPAFCSYHSKSFKGTIPDNLGESSKLLYSKNQDGLASLRWVSFSFICFVDSYLRIVLDLFSHSPEVLLSRLRSVFQPCLFVCISMVKTSLEYIDQSPRCLVGLQNISNQ